MNIRKLILFLVVTIFAGAAWALDASGQRYIEQMTQGGMSSIKQAARDMYHTGETNTQVLDVAAEVLLQNYLTASDPDAMAWVAKALGHSRNGRYYGVLKEVADSKADKRILKHTANALKEIGSASGNQYVKGSVNLKTVSKSRGASPSASKKSAAKSNNQGYQGLEVIKKGMSMQEAYNLVGPPTSSSAHPTGKAWIPFNFKGSDTVRTYALYKGKGQIIFSSESHYSSNMRVLEVKIDPNESGYP